MSEIIATNSRIAQLPPARCPQYLYICSSKQMPGVFKVGETHHQSPIQRARQFSGIDKKVIWEVNQIFETPDSRYSEKLVHRNLKANDFQVEGFREIFSAPFPQIVSIIQACIGQTPNLPAKSLRPADGEVAVPRAKGPWRAALAMPVSYAREPSITLARAMAIAAAGDDGLKRRLMLWGVELVYPDEQAPTYRIHALENSVLANWLKIQKICWSDLQIDTSSSRKIKCHVR